MDKYCIYFHIRSWIGLGMQNINFNLNSKYENNLNVEEKSGLIYLRFIAASGHSYCEKERARKKILLFDD